jgi:hypothetical protein
MDNQIIHEHRVRISRSYFRRIANLLKLERFDEAANDTLYFASIQRLWAVQDKKTSEAAAKDGCAEQRNKFAAK